MIEIGSRLRDQAPPPQIVFEALTQPARDPVRRWLDLLDDEVTPLIVRAEPPSLVIWSSLWRKRPDALIRFDLEAQGSRAGTGLRWTVLVDEPAPDDALVGHFRKRMNQLINRDLRYSFGQ